MEYYAAVTKEDSLAFAVTWTDLESITQSEINQTGKDKYHRSSLPCGI